MVTDRSEEEVMTDFGEVFANNISAGDGDVSSEADSNETKLTREELESRLKHSYFIMGGGAWQQNWEAHDSIGFSADKVNSVVIHPSVESLKQSIRPELLKRFRDDVCFLMPMTAEDYKDVANAISAKLPERMRLRFINLVKADLHVALKQNLNMRFFERVLTQTLLESNSQTIEYHDQLR